MKSNVLIAGAGFGGLELATILSEQLGAEADVILIDKNPSFYFGLSKIDVMFGKIKSEAVHHYYADIKKPGIRFIQADILSIDPEAKTVRTSQAVFSADYLVIALGADYDYAATPGLNNYGHEFYSLKGAVKISTALSAFSGGDIIIGVCGAPYKCPPAPSEAALLMHDYLKGKGIREKCSITIVHPLARPIPPSPDSSVALLQAFKEKGIRFIPDTGISEIQKNILVLKDGQSLPFDLFLGVPVHCAPAVLSDSGLLVDGWIPVNRHNLMTRYMNVYAVGDITSVGTPKAGVFAEGAGRIAAQSILASLGHGEMDESFSGKGSCYVEFGEGRVGKVDVDFFSGPSPVAVHREASFDNALEKIRFVEERVQRWFS